MFEFYLILILTGILARKFEIIFIYLYSLLEEIYVILDIQLTRTKFSIEKEVINRNWHKTGKQILA